MNFLALYARRVSDQTNNASTRRAPAQTLRFIQRRTRCGERQLGLDQIQLDYIVSPRRRSVRLCVRLRLQEARASPLPDPRAAQQARLHARQTV